MGTLAIGDLHFKYNKKGINNLDIMEDVCAQLLSIIQQKNPKSVVILGDTLHDHEKISQYALYKANKFIESIEGYFIRSTYYCSKKMSKNRLVQIQK